MEKQSTSLIDDRNDVIQRSEATKDLSTGLSSPMSSGDTSPLSSRGTPSLSSRDTPSLSSGDTPPMSSGDTPPMSSGDTPLLSSPRRRGSRKKDLVILDLGLRPYAEVWNLQKQIVKERLEESRSDTLILVEHPHVITKGRRTDPSEILDERFPVFEVERGGRVTYHGPGQLVGYPIINIGRHRKVKGYVRALEEVLIRTLGDFNIEALQKEGCTGVWVDGGNKKIASIGVAVKKWVTYHGFALNVNTDLSAFNTIQPCGFDCVVMTSMEALLGKQVAISDVKRSVTNACREVLSTL